MEVLVQLVHNHDYRENDSQHAHPVVEFGHDIDVGNELYGEIYQVLLVRSDCHTIRINVVDATERI